MIKTITASEFMLIYAICAVIIYTGLTYLFTNSKKRLSNNGVIGLKLLGILLFGIIPAIFMMFKKYDALFFNVTSDNFYWTLIFVLIFTPIIVLINYKLSKKLAHSKEYPQIKIAQWRFDYLIGNVFLWMLYLTAYEFLFRGVLLFVGIKYWGVFLSIVVNVTLYTLAHLPKGKFETLGAIPLGIFFCIISIITNSFFAAGFLHCVIAISNDLFCIKAKSFEQVKTVSK